MNKTAPMNVRCTGQRNATRSFPRRAPGRSPSLRVRARNVLEEEEKQRRQSLEDELIADNIVDYLLPRQIRQVVSGFSAGSCLLGAFLSLAAALGNTSAMYDNGSLQNVGINLLGAAGFAAFFILDKQAGEKRIQRRKAKRKEEVKRGDRIVVVDRETGLESSKLAPVDDRWILRKLEAMGKKDNLPFIGPEKAAILQRLVREKDPKVAVEVGTMAAYSAISIAQALNQNGKIITIEKDLQWSLVARRFLYQASQGEKNDRRKVALGDKVEVVLGDARDKFKEISEKHGRFDFLFLDGVPKETLEYLRAAEPYMNPGCTVVADNAVVFAEGGMKGYLEYVRDPANGYTETRTEKCTLEWRPDVADGLEVSVRS